MPRSPSELPVRAVKVGRRARKDVGNVLGLAESIRRVGLLHPVVVNSRHELVAGYRRLQAVKKLNWDMIPVRVVAGLDDAAAALKAELYENTDREPLAPTEMVELGRMIEELERPEAKKREHSGKRPSGNFPEGSPGETRDKVGEALGVSGRTYEKAKQVVEAAEADPEGMGDLPDLMDSSSVDAAHKEMKRRSPFAPLAPSRQPRDKPLFRTEYDEEGNEERVPTEELAQLQEEVHTARVGAVDTGLDDYGFVAELVVLGERLRDGLIELRKRRGAKSPEWIETCDLIEKLLRLQKDC